MATLSPGRRSALDFSDLSVDVATPVASNSRPVLDLSPTYSERSYESLQARSLNLEETTPLKNSVVEVRQTTPFHSTHFRDAVTSQASPNAPTRPSSTPDSFLHTRGTGRFSTPGISSKSASHYPSPKFTPRRSMTSIMGSHTHFSHHEDLGATSDIMEDSRSLTPKPKEQTFV